MIRDMNRAMSVVEIELVQKLHEFSQGHRG